MSWWTYVTGVIVVDVPARTTEQAEYIMKTVLNHLPQVTGSEGNMQVYMALSRYRYTSQSWDEFGNSTKNMIDGSFEIYHGFLLTVSGNLRDREVPQAYREFVHWLCRLSKRVGVEDICVKITDHDGKERLITDHSPFDNMYETESNWVEQIEGPRWWEEFQEPKIQW